MRVLHAFDLALPATLSWVDKLMIQLSKDIDIDVASPWIVQNEFYRPEQRNYLLSPLQKKFFPVPANEFEHPLPKKILLAIEKRLPLYRKHLAQLLQVTKPDVIHAHFGPIGYHYLPLALELKVPMVCTFYGFDYEKLPQLQPIYRERYRFLFKNAETIVTGSNEGTKKLIGMGCPPDKITIVPPSLPAGSFAHVPVSKKSPNALRLVQVASFTAKKGHLDTLKAFRKAMADCPGCRLTLAGEEAQPQIVKAVDDYIQKNNLSHVVQRVSFVPHMNIADFLKDFDVFIHPSHHTSDGDHEDLPVVILEAQAAGLPVISTNHFGIPTEVLHKKTGLLAEEHDVDALANYIRRFYQMSFEEYQQFSNNARKHVNENFALEKSALKLLEIYKNISRNI